MTAKEMGRRVSCDLNYRGKLWKWGKLPNEIMPELIQYTDVVIGNGEAAEKCFGIKASDANTVNAKVENDTSLYLCENLAKRFSNLETIAITLRHSISASHNSLSGVLWNRDGFYKGPRYEITHIVDRFGSGDSFAGGLIYGLLFYDNPQLALNYAMAASCLKHSIFGDINLVSKSEVEKLMMGDESGRVSR
jgi:2-dehydro-3-deoxygluconokinase